MNGPDTRTVHQGLDEEDIDANSGHLKNLLLPLHDGLALVEKNFNELSPVERLALFQLAVRGEIAIVVDSIDEPTIVFSHFMVINIVTSTLREDPRVVSFYPDNCSITELESSKGKLKLVSTGNELQTKIN